MHGDLTALLPASNWGQGPGRTRADIGTGLRREMVARSGRTTVAQH